MNTNNIFENLKNVKFLLMEDNFMRFFLKRGIMRVVLVE